MDMWTKKQEQNEEIWMCQSLEVCQEHARLVSPKKVKSKNMILLIKKVLITF